jgi:hypothetical protein
VAKWIARGGRSSWLNSWPAASFATNKRKREDPSRLASCGCSQKMPTLNAYLTLDAY